MNDTEKQKLLEFAKHLKVKFNNLKILKTALTHRSFINEVAKKPEHNERLEYLGDAVLELIITEHLYHTYPDFKEGELTSFRSATVRTTSLAETAQKLHIGKYIYLSNGEEKTGGRERPYILANTFEAILGAMFLDQDLECVKGFLNWTLIPKIISIVNNRLDIDSKSKFQELSQEHFSITPTYHLISETGPDHDKTFKISVKIGSRVFGSGTGHNKQEAEANAAKEGVDNWHKLIDKFKKGDIK